VYHISNRTQALQATKEAINWCSLKTLSPAQGEIDHSFREKLRNEALNNVSIYLLRLRDILEDPHRLNRLSLDSLSLARRMLKEITVAALLHDEFYDEGQHIVKALNLRYENDPSLLNQVLRQHSESRKNLPDLSQEKFAWLRRAHNVMSYPTSLPISSSHAPELRDVITRFQRLRTEEENLETVDKEFTVMKSGEEIRPENHAHKVEQFIHELERLYLFPALEATLQTLTNGFLLVTQL